MSSTLRALADSLATGLQSVTWAIASTTVERKNWANLDVEAMSVPHVFVVPGNADVTRINKVPKNDRVTSWKTSRFPGGYLRSQIQSDFSMGKRSVVIGPEVGGRDPQVNQLHERGGSATYYFVPGGIQRKSGKTVYGTLTNRPPRISGTKITQVGLYRFTRTVKGRHFMERGLEKAKKKIPECWRGKLRIG